VGTENKHFGDIVLESQIIGDIVMPETKTAVLEKKVASLEQEIEGLQGAIRRLSGQLNDVVASVATFTESVSDVKTQLNSLRKAVKNAPQDTGVSVTPYG
jgi:chromosome segregation ATPase